MPFRTDPSACHEVVREPPWPGARTSGGRSRPLRTPSLSCNSCKIVGQPDGKGDDRQGRISISTSRENRTTHHEQVADPMHLEISVDHASFWIIMHAGGAHVVFAAL